MFSLIGDLCSLVVVVFSSPETSSTLLFIFRTLALVLSGMSVTAILISQGLLLSSMGENGWKILIPFYGQYLFYKRAAGVGDIYIEYIVCIGISAVLYLCSPALGILFLLVPLFCTFLLSVFLANECGRPFIFGLGLFVFPYVFYPVLACTDNSDAEKCAA